MAVWLETDVQPEFDCRTCNGVGNAGGYYCRDCGGDGWFFPGGTLATLCHNLAIAGALTWSFALGVLWVADYDRSRRRGAWPLAWHPNADGRPALDPGTPPRGER